MLADLQKGLEGMLREPHGCFEQTSTTNYPNLLVLDYLRESNQNNPEIEKRALALLENGYAKLTAFECMNAQNKKQGYEWFGGTAPAHEALTAYGLLQFRDMSRVMNVDHLSLRKRGRPQARDRVSSLRISNHQLSLRLSRRKSKGSG